MRTTAKALTCVQITMLNFVTIKIFEQEHETLGLGGIKAKASLDFNAVLPELEKCKNLVLNC